MVRPDQVTGQWLHAWEDDTDDGAQVYRPAKSEFNLSRRPRRGIELKADGRAIVLEPGPGDAREPHLGKWTFHGDHVEITFDDGQPGLSIAADPDDEHRLIVPPSNDTASTDR